MSLRTLNVITLVATVPTAGAGVVLIRYDPVAVVGLALALALASVCLRSLVD